jgi:threonine synthase
MGLPIGKLVVATNENDILARFWKSGRYEKVDSSPQAALTNDASGVKETLSPAMDILVSSNFERLLWYLAFENTESIEGNIQKHDEACRTVEGWMSKMKSNGRVEVPVSVLEAARRDFLAERISDELTSQTIKTYFNEEKYVADPHTAVGLAAARIVAAHNSPKTYQIVLSTAHPAKFSEAAAQALAQNADFNFERDVLPQEFEGLLEKERRVVDVERPDIVLVKEVIDRYAS